ISGMGLRIREATYKDGLTDLDALSSAVTESTGAVLLQQPNFFGNIEPAREIGAIAKSKGAMFVVSVDPISLGMLTPPGEYGADIVTGEGQSLGIPPAFGGPLLGLFATLNKHVWSLPGRLVGQTQDSQGHRGFVLTLQTREQHIRRERATSNICTNQALMAVAAAVYLSALGKNGLAQVADLCFKKAHYAYRQLLLLPGIEPVWNAPFFKEFVIRTSISPDELNAELLDKGILGGLSLGQYYPELSNCLMFAVTEKRTRQEIDHLMSVIKSYVRKQTRAAHI
ncbi:MAG: glycine dehydrogenase, partial [Armatimonadota bacterium]|nr:glycine dehydrogenase [Armatimonadota bacterium]